MMIDDDDGWMDGLEINRTVEIDSERNALLR